MRAPQAALLLAAAIAGCGREGVLECGAPALPLAEIRQRVLSASAEPVEVEGIVSGDFTSGLGGFFIEPESAEGPGLFVLGDPAAKPLAPGEKVRVRGRPARLPPEMFERFALVEVEAIVRCGTTKAAPLTLSAPPADPEALLGRRVRIPGPLFLAGQARIASHGELVVAFGEERPFQPTELFPPGDAARAFAERQQRRMLVLDDGRMGPPEGGLPWYWTAEPKALRTGGLLFGLEGVIDRGEEGFTLRLSASPERIEAAARPGPPAREPEALRVIAFNLENFFNGDGRGGGFPTPRGAADSPGFERQAAKLLAALKALDGDLLILSELENDGYEENSAIAELTRRLNAGVEDAKRYQFVRISGARLGEDEIAVGILYRPARLEAIGQPAFLERAEFARGLSRVPLAASFRSRAGELSFTAVAVHLKSKGSCPQSPGPDADQGDGQGCWNAARSAAMRALLDWVRGDPTGSGVTAWLIAGDFNAHGEEEPLAIARQAGALDALRATAGSMQLYSYVFRGLSGRLDHIVLSPELAPALRGAGVWHINADEPALLGHAGAFAEEETAYRSSDHDPVWIELGDSPRPP
ncbi:MAG: nuclease [Lysobacterales bacterium]|jgi:predicted extracellular nuclease|nr:MAG: nuclease [Xanthomonadales bacterium]